MNLNFNKGNEVENVSTRVKKTKQEIEQLKNELEKLINFGTQPSFLKPVSERKPPELEKISPKPAHLIPQEPQTKSNASLTQKKIEPPKTFPSKSVPVIQKKPEPAKVSPAKKSRNYNVNEAREYIKKQKEKRAEQLKAQIHVADNQLDLKKQKLKELHQKTLELVNKNVQLKRERSKSRDREPPVRLDKSKPWHKSQETIPKSRQNLSSKSQERQKLSVTSRVKSQERAKSQERVKVQEVKPPSNGRASRARARDKIEKNASVPSSGAQKVDPNFLRPPKAKVGKTDKTIDLEKTVFPPSEDIVDLNRRIISVPSPEEPDSVNLDTKKNNRPKKQKPVLEHSIMTDACLKDTKETQTTRQNDFEGVAWMQPPPALPYPYNFINTVKRKLHYAINSPKSCVDVGVQNSGESSIQTPDAAKVKSKEEIKELLIKSASDLRSFASHRGPNLDLRVVENLELIPNNGVKDKETVSKNLFTAYDSESDTSKNIPEISSESLGSAKTKPRLSLDKVRDLKLQKIPKSWSHSIIKTDTNGYVELDADGYSSDFQKESIQSGGTTSGKSGGSTIKTITSEKKLPDLSVGTITNRPESGYPNYDNSRSISSEVSIVSSVVNSSSSSTSKDTKDDASRHSEIQSYSNNNKDARSEGESQNTFKSLLTESHSSKRTSGPESEMSNSEPVTESLGLKKPSMSLSVKNSDLHKNLMNSITIRDSNLKDKGDGDSQKSLRSLVTEGGAFKSSGESVLEILDENRKSRTAESKIGEFLSLKEPQVSLVFGKEQKREDVKSQMKNITLRPTASAANNVNEIHLKFEAEVRLLNDFNESFKQFIAVEKAFENLKTKNETNLAMTKILQNVDTQTSIITKTSTNVTTPRDTRNSSINFSRGSEITEDLNDSVMNNNRNTSKSFQNSTFSTDWNLSNLNESTTTNLSLGEEGKSRLSISSLENCNAKNCASVLSLNIFDQLIKDEDTRIQQLKAIIKIREQALLDRTKSELVWLEIQKKQLIETGKIEEASLLKKKQRGIILKHEQERNEIKKLKQMQKEASEHRKNTLKQQRNFIKTQLSTDNMLSKITVKKQRKEKRSTGPLRVVQSCSESIHSETSISLKSSGIEDVLSITSKSIRVSEESELDFSKEEVPVSNARRTLLMREAALQKRRKAAEELLRWHRKLLDEERKIGELEAAATSVVRQPADPHKYRFSGKQLNQLWRNMTGSEEKKFVEEKTYAMSQIALERLCKSARQYSKRVAHAKSESSVTERRSTDDVNYSSAFEPDSVQEIISQEEKTKISSISELISNFSRIEDEISTLSKKSEDIVSLKEDLEKSSQSLKSAEKTEDSEISSIKDIEEEVPSVVEVVEESEKKDDVSREAITEKSAGEDKEAESVEGEILTKNEELEVPVEDELIVSRKEDSEELKTSREVSQTIEEQQKITTDEEILTGKDEFEELKSVHEISATIEEEKITIDEQVSIEKDVEVEAIPKIEDLGEKSIQGQKSVTDEQISNETENLEESEVSTIEEQEIASDEYILSTKEDLEGAETVEGVSTFVEDHKIIEEISSEKDLEVKKDQTISSEQISTEKEEQTSTQVEDLEEHVPSMVEDQGVVTEEVSKESEALEDLENQKSLDDLSSTQYEYVDKLPKPNGEEVSEPRSVKDEESEKLEIPTSEDKEESPDEGAPSSIEDKEELSSVPLTESIKEETIEVTSKEIAKSLSLDEALESASKIEESLSKLNEKFASEKKDEEISEVSTGKDVESIEETPSKSETTTSAAPEPDEKTPQKKSTNQIDVKKRVSEILADANLSRGDKSPKLQDLYVTAYDVGAPPSREFNETLEEGRQMPTDIFGSEAEELWRKQLAIEQEIKQIELQQKEQLPYVYMREIPNKPPPPYTPPSSLSSLPQSILPSEVKEITEIACYSSKVLYKAYQNNTLDKVKFSENGFKLFSKVEITKICADFIFNICKDIARDHYRQFEEVEEPSWLVLAKKPQLAKTKPADADGLEKILNRKLKELFGFKKAQIVESAIVKWGRKKRDHVDEVLVIESQEEESQWTNFDKDELIVKNQVTEYIMKMLLEETAGVFAKIISKKKCAIGDV